MIELKPCPKCGRRPLLGYACGEYFVVGQTGGCGVCDTFGEMHASKEQEVEAWNRKCDRKPKEAHREGAEKDRPYDHLYDMYWDEFETLEGDIDPHKKGKGD